MNAEKAKKMTVEEALKELGEWYAGFADKPSEEALKVIMDAAQKHIPKKPKGDYHSVPHYRCPVCNKSVKTYEDSYKIPFCCWCGNALDWSEVEK